MIPRFIKPLVAILLLSFVTLSSAQSGFLLGFEDAGPFEHTYVSSGGATNLSNYYGGCIASDSAGNIYSVGSAGIYANVSTTIAVAATSSPFQTLSSTTGMHIGDVLYFPSDGGVKLTIQAIASSGVVTLSGVVTTKKGDTVADTTLGATATTVAVTSAGTSTETLNSVLGMHVGDVLFFPTGNSPGSVSSTILSINTNSNTVTLGTPIATANSGDTVIDTTTSQFHIVSYDQYGDRLWEIYPTAPNELAYNMRAATVSGNYLYVVATGRNSSEGDDIILFQVSLDGSTVTSKTYSDATSPSMNAVASAIVVENNEAYVFGYQETNAAQFTYNREGGTPPSPENANDLIELTFDLPSLTKHSPVTLVSGIDALLLAMPTTSTNSGQWQQWATYRADYVYALLDKNKNIQIAANGSNTADAPGVPDGQVLTWNPGTGIVYGPEESRHNASVDLGDEIIGLTQNNTGTAIYVGCGSYLVSPAAWEFNAEKYDLTDTWQTNTAYLPSGCNGAQPESIAASPTTGLVAMSGACSNLGGDLNATVAFTDSGSALTQKWVFGNGTTLPWWGDFAAGTTSIATDAYGYIYALFGSVNSVSQPLVYKLDPAGDGLGNGKVLWSYEGTDGPAALWDYYGDTLAAAEDYIDSNMFVDPASGNVSLCLTGETHAGDGLQSVNNYVPEMWTIQLQNAPVAAANASYSTPNGSPLNVTATPNGLLAQKADEYAEGGECVLDTLPAHGFVWLASDGSFFYFPNSGYSGPDSFTYQIVKESYAEGTSVASNVATVTINVEPAVTILSLPQGIVGGPPGGYTKALCSVSLPLPSVVLGSSPLKVNLSAVTEPTFPAYTIDVTGTSNTNHITSVNIGPGLSSASFDLYVPQVTNGSILQVTASDGNNTLTGFIPLFPDISSVSAASTVQGGLALPLTVSLGGSTVSAANVALFSNGAAISVPSVAIVPQGSSSVAVSCTTLPVAVATPVTITAQEYGGSAKQTKMVTVEPATLKSLGLSVSSIVGGKADSATVTLTGLSAGQAVTLSSANTAVATVPSSVTVASGKTTATFVITTKAVSSATTVKITATLGATTGSVVLTVNP